jgi:hypothetical protein
MGLVDMDGPEPNWPKWFLVTHAGALAFKRVGDPAMGSFSDAFVLKTFGEVPDRLDEL